MEKELLDKAEFERKQDQSHQQNGVVPGSHRDLKINDGDGNRLFRVTVLKFQLDDYMRCMKKIGYQCREFKYDI